MEFAQASFNSDLKHASSGLLPLYPCPDVWSLLVQFPASRQIGIGQIPDPISSALNSPNHLSSSYTRPLVRTLAGIQRTLNGPAWGIRPDS
jgi:hypothetical protein